MANAKSWILLTVSGLILQFIQVHSEVATTNNQLALKLYYHLAKSSDGDFLFSPFSLSSLISVLGSMAGSGTLERISGAMQFSDDYTQVTNDYKRLLIEFQRLQSLNGTRLELQQKDDLKLSPEFKFILAKYLFEISPLKFSSASGGNYLQNRNENYVSTILKLGNRTETEIDQLLQLKSTVSFKGSWAYPFNPVTTKPSPFYNLTRRPFLVEMMFQRMEIPYADIESLDCTAIALPYRLNYTFGGKFSEGDGQEEVDSRLELVIFLPNSLTGLKDLEAKLVQQPFSVTMREFKGTKDLFIYLPKFSLKSELDMKPALKQVGLDSLFLTENSNFYKIFEDKDRAKKSTGDFGVLKTSHFGRFSVDEYGTNGYTSGFRVKKIPAIKKHLNPEVFRVDRPFIGIVYDNVRHMVLLMFRKVDFETIDPLRRIAVPDALAVPY